MTKLLTTTCATCEKEFTITVDEELHDMYHRWHNGDVTSYDQWNFTRIATEQSSDFNEYSLIRHGKCQACREKYYKEIYGEGYLEETLVPSKFKNKNKNKKKKTK